MSNPDAFEQEMFEYAAMERMYQQLQMATFPRIVSVKVEDSETRLAP